MNIEDLRKINKQKIEKLKDIHNDENIKKQRIIQEKIYKIIGKDDMIFFKLEMNESLNIINCLVDCEKDELLKIYKDLISASNFK